MTWHATLLRRALTLTDNVGEAMLAVEVALAQQPQPIDAFLAHDIFNKAAQRILDRALKEASKLSITARRELELAIKLTDPLDSARAIVDFIRRYRVGLANLLGTTSLAALLEGAREVASHIPVIPPAGIGLPVPPSLEPAEAVKLVDDLRKLAEPAREQRIYVLPGAQQEYVRAALRIEASPPGPPFVPILPGSDEPGRIHFPIIEEAGRELSTKNVMTREQFDRLDAAARQKAFTVAGVDAEETLTTILDLLAENVREGANYETFRKKVLAAVDEGTFLSESHIEVIFRTNIQAAFSDGQMTVLRHPFIAAGFPYAQISAISDDRVRHEHLAMEKYGIDGGAIYRISDPVFQTFRAPWSYNCLLPGTLVSGRYQIGLKSFYAGMTVEITTSLGSRITITANHPVITLRGTIPAREVKEGDYCLSYLPDVEFQRNGAASSEPTTSFGVSSHQIDDYHEPIKVEEVFSALSVLGSPRHIRSAPDDLHGEAKFGDGNIEIVGAYGKLLLDDHASVSQSGSNFFLATIESREASVDSLRVLDLGFQGPNSTTLGFASSNHGLGHLFGLSLPDERCGFASGEHPKSSALKMVHERSNAEAGFSSQNMGAFAGNVSVMESGDTFDFNGIKQTVLGSQGSVFSPETSLDFGNSSHLYASINERFGERLVVDAFLASQLVNGFPGQIAADQVIEVREDYFRGHVYDLQGSPSLIIGNGLLLANCRCSWIPLTIRHAADLGLAEAKQWFATGKEPLPPAFVSMPPFSPPPGFRRDGVPLSIRLSMDAIEAAFGMVGDEWHGPNPPAEGWVEVGRGARGGKIWKPQYRVQQTAQQPTKQPAQAAIAPADVHPLANAKTAEEVLAAVNPENPSAMFATWKNPNPLNYNESEFLPGVDGKRLQESVLASVQEQAGKNAFQRLTMPQVYEASKAKQPNLTYWQFQNGMAKLQKDRVIRLGPWTQAMSTHPDPKLLMPLNREMEWFVGPA